MHKISSQGRYLRYEGLTIIMPVQTLLSPTFHQAHDLIEQWRATAALAALPVSSYHVTLSGLLNRREKPSLDGYNEAVDVLRARLQRVKWLLSQEDPAASLTFVAKDARKGRTAVSMTLVPKTPADAARLEYLNALIARTLGDFYDFQPRSHMSVGYHVVDHPTNASIDTRQAFRVQPLLPALEKIFHAVDISVALPQICFFANMTVFTPL